MDAIAAAFPAADSSPKIVDKLLNPFAIISTFCFCVNSAQFISSSDSVLLILSNAVALPFSKLTIDNPCAFANAINLS